MPNQEVRVRFAPSPTGALHIGGVRTALYNYLFARQMGGKFLLRIEDTDSQRFVPGAEQYIIESLEWCGIHVDEGVGVGGPHAPYRQSERREIYLKYALELVANGHAYYAFDTPEQLDAIRTATEERGDTFAYNYSVRTQLQTSLSLPADDVSQRIERGDQWVIRFKMPEDRAIEMDDRIRGRVVVNSSTLDDKVLFKSSDKLPTYHLANIVDDHLMQITHVIRGEEWLPSLPLHYMLYEAFGWSATQPEFAHLPLLLKPTGKGKLSKRDGDKLGFPVFPLEWRPADGEPARGYREDGYLPQAFVNMLALLGWNPGGDHSEIMSMEQMVELFSLEKVSKSGARFDPEKAKWFNAQYLHAADDASIAAQLLPVLASHGVSFEGSASAHYPDRFENQEAFVAKVERVVGMVKERATFVSDLWDLSHYLFVAPQSYELKSAAKFWSGDTPAQVQELRERLARAEDFTAAALEPMAKEWIKERELPMGKIMNALRLALVGASEGIGVFEIAEIIGREQTLARLETIHQRLG